MAERWEAFKDRFTALEASHFNLDLEQRHDYTARNGWHLDTHEADLPAEAPGQPAEHGSFRAAVEIIRSYKFPPPDLITGLYRPDEPLERRVMLLEARFLFFRFLFGVRITDVLDEEREDGGVRERIWGYSYATLEGHFERGQITFSVHKALESGAVKFRIDSFSRTGTIRNPLYALGFWLFGRRLQRRFAAQSLSRMQRLVREVLETGGTTAQSVPVQPTATDPEAQEKLKDLTGKAGT